MISMDKIVDKIAALGIPGIVLLTVISTSGVAGAAALTSALAFLGGPWGMLAGIGALGVIGLLSRGLAEYGFEAIYTASIQKLKSEKGLSTRKIIDEINGYPISKGLKLKLIDKITSV